VTAAVPAAVSPVGGVLPAFHYFVALGVQRPRRSVARRHGSQKEYSAEQTDEGECTSETGHGRLNGS
jgi:hypothetical protein